MPDPNKHAVLAARGFKIQKVCSTCSHWDPSMHTKSGWGTCALAEYEHEKHTKPMKAGTPEIGGCDDHAVDPRYVTYVVGEDYALRYSEDQA